MKALQQAQRQHHGIEPDARKPCRSHRETEMTQPVHPRSVSTAILPRGRDKIALGELTMTSFLQDIRYSLRALARKPGFTLIAVLTLAIGIGSNTAIFGVFNTVLLRPLPYRAPDRLVWITEVLKASTADEVTVSADFLEWRRQNHVFSRIAAFNYWTRNLTGTGEPQQLQAAKASADLLPLLG